MLNALVQTYYAIADHAPLESVVRTFLWHVLH